MKLSILIATVPERRAEFLALKAEFYRQIKAGGFANLVELVINPAPRGTISIGTKSQIMLMESKGDYVVRFDDDDFPKPWYISDIMEALRNNPDCVGFKIYMTTNGKNPETCIHSLANSTWEKKNGVYLRTVTHFNPVRRDIALAVGYPDKSFGEDKDFSDGVTPLCKHEVYIDKFMFDYRYTNKVDHNTKYGIK